jgi:hypothetical protein
MAMEVDGRQLLVKINKISSKHWQPLVALRGDVDDFQTLIN